MYVKKSLNSRKIAQACALVLTLAAPLAFADAYPGGSGDPNANGLGPTGLVKTVIDSASKYRDVNAALDDGYAPATGCVSGPYGGAQGVHYVRFDLIGDGVLDPGTPEVLLYEPTPWGTMRLAGAEYLTIKEAWHAQNGEFTPPVVGGQHMFLLDEPNRFVIPAAYALRVWAFKKNPTGIFALSNMSVTCEYYSPEG